MNAQLNLFDFDTPSMPILDVTRCYSRPVNYQTAAHMVEEFHYAHRVPSIVLAIGMYVDDVLAGVCCYGTGASPRAMAVCGIENAPYTLELNRLFVHEWAGRNSESWLIGQSFRYLQQYRPDIKVLVSFADTGESHLGIIYQATNWLYTGLSFKGGTSSKILVDGKEYTSKTFFGRYGTQSKDVILEYHPDAVFETTSLKHRYIMFLGTKHQKQALREKLKYPVLPYPKGYQS